MLSKVQELERTVYTNSKEFNTIRSRQALEDISKNTRKYEGQIQKLLLLAKQELRVMEEHRDISSKHVQLTEKQFQMEEQKMRTQDETKYHEYHQLFRLIRNEKDNSYEWYKDRVEDRVAGTCQWFLEQQHFKNWIEEDTGLLVVTADPRLWNISFG